MIPDPILYLYTIGIVLFAIGLEKTTKEFDFKIIIYLGLAFFVNYMGYELSYTSTDYTQLAYFPLIFLILSIIILLWVIFENVIKPMVDTTYKEDKD